MDQNHRRGSVSEPHRRRCGPGPLGDRGCPGRDGPRRCHGLFSCLAATVTGWAEQGAAYFQGVEALQAEKASLEKEVAQLQAAARAGGAGPAGECPPPGPAGLAGDRLGPHPHPAWVIARTPDNWQGEVTLDQGRPRASSPASAWWTTAGPWWAG